MEKDNPITKEVEFLFVSQRIRLLGIAIIAGMALVFILGIFVSSSNVNKELAYFNLISIILCVLLCFGSFYVKKMLLQKAGAKKFIPAYFNAHVLPFAMCDFGGLLCIATNLFINQNLYFASGGFVIAFLYMIVNFPSRKDLELIK